MLSQNKDWFKYDGYWKTWNRVLTRMGGDNNPVEIEITIHPGKLTGASSWETISELRIRRHRTPSDSSDVWTHHLPDNIYNEIVEALGEDFAKVLVHVDLLSHIQPNFHHEEAESGGSRLRSIYQETPPQFLLYGTGKGLGYQTLTNKTLFVNAIGNVGIMLPKHVKVIGGISIKSGYDSLPSFTMISYHDVNKDELVGHFSVTHEGDSIFTVRSPNSPLEWKETVLKTLDFVWNKKENYPWVAGELFKDHLNEIVKHAEGRFSIINVI